VACKAVFSGIRRAGALPGVQVREEVTRLKRAVCQTTGVIMWWKRAGLLQAIIAALTEKRAEGVVSAGARGGEAVVCAVCVVDRGSFHAIFTP